MVLAYGQSGVASSGWIKNVLIGTAFFPNCLGWFIKRRLKVCFSLRQCPSGLQTFPYAHFYSFILGGQWQQWLSSAVRVIFMDMKHVAVTAVCVLRLIPFI